MKFRLRIAVNEICAPTLFDHRLTILCFRTLRNPSNQVCFLIYVTLDHQLIIMSVLEPCKIKAIQFCCVDFWSMSRCNYISSTKGCYFIFPWSIEFDPWVAGTSESGFLKFEKWKVKIKSFHSFLRSAKWKKNAFTLFREVKSEIKMLQDRDREVKILENS